MRSLLDPPWSIRVQDKAPLTLLVVVRGHAWVMPDEAEPTRIDPGDVAVFRGPQPYTVADDPATPPQVILHPGQVTTTPDGELLCESLDLGVRSWGTNPNGAVALVTGTYEVSSAVSKRLLRSLSPLIVVRAKELDSPLPELLAREVAKDEPAQCVVLDRLLDLLLVAALRAWYASPAAPATPQAFGDPVVGAALRLMQDSPAHPWTVASLASAVGTSRAALAKRFTDLVGDPPMAFLTEWRIALAADLLRGSDAPIDSIARHVGYSSAFALSAAFKRQFGVSPRAHRVGA